MPHVYSIAMLKTPKCLMQSYGLWAIKGTAGGGMSFPGWVASTGGSTYPHFADVAMMEHSQLSMKTVLSDEKKASLSERNTLSYTSNPA